MVKIEKLRFKNFKSFQSVNIPLAEGYTVIIGPNGSGKSNCVDAIAFVLGSNSMKSLRAEKLVDLVNSKAADDLAEVEMTIRNNSDTHMISRSIDRSGTSVFRLNKRRTTKSNVEEFLLSLNIRPDGHNIIMQGDVTNVIEMTPVQRRGIVDEVSGIAEYELKKQESLNELEKVEDKRKEATIILQERKTYLDVLEKEKIEAEVYKKLIDEKQAYEASIVKQELDSIDKVFEKNKKDVDESVEKLNKLKERETESQQEADGLDKKSQDLSKQILEESEAKQSGARQEIESIKSQIAVLEEKLSNSKKEIDKSNENKQALNQEISKIGNEIKEKEDELEKLFTEIDEIKKQMREKEKTLQSMSEKAHGFDKNIEEKYAQLEKITTDMDKEKDQMHAVEIDAKSLTERLKLKKAAVDAKDLELNKFKEKKSEVDKKVNDIVENKKVLEKAFKKASDELEEALESEAKYKIESDELTKKLIHANQRIAALDSKITVMKSLSGRGKVVEALMKAQSLTGIQGTVGDLCSYKPEYAGAIEAAAGPRLYYIVTDTAANAAKALKYLKENKLGKATFIPLDKLKTPDTENLSKYTNKDGIIGTALGLLKFNEKLQKVFEYSLGDAIVVRDIDVAKDVGIGKVRMSTLDGDLCETSGVISGGFTKQGISANEIEELETLKKSTEKMTERKTFVEKELSKASSGMNKLRDVKAESELKSREAEINLKQWEQRIKEYEQTYLDSQHDSNTVLSEIKAMEESVKLKQAQLAEFETKLNEQITQRKKLKMIFDDPRVKDVQDQMNDIKKSFEAMKEQETKLSIHTREIKSEIEKVLMKNRRDTEQKVKIFDAEIISIEKQMWEIEEQRKVFIKSLKDKENEARSLATSMTTLFKQKDDIEEDKKRVWQRLGRYSREVQRMEDIINEFKTDAGRLETRRKELIREWSKFESKEIKLLDKSMSVLKQALVDIETKMARFGYVNMKAIDMYEEHKKEVRDIETKSSKLDEERKQILSIIEEIEKKKIASFTETFNALNVYFDKYYREFYPEEGTKAQLRLQEPEKPLETGLILEAKPGAKHIKNLEAMSGGEKVVTALAFLFAIQAYKPSPFYVLDEVDAALDPENSERVAKMLKKFSKELQFVVVTHNTIVTKNSDQVIGVHMNSQGSSVVEVNLRGLVAAEGAANFNGLK